VIIKGVAPRVSSPVLIGRSSELERLRAALERTSGGQSGTTLIAGEAGVGKTRLIEAVAEPAREDGFVVLTGGCIDLGDGSLPYAPVIEALRGYVGHADPDEIKAVVGHGRPELAHLMPDLGPVAAAGGGEFGLSVGSAQGRLFELLLGVLTRIAERHPLLFVVEDLHWSDRSTRDLLGFLVRNLRDSAVMLVLSYRSDELHRRHPLLPFIAELERTGKVERVELHPFDRLEAGAQLQAIAGRELDASLLESIHARSGGNAFFAEELLVAAGEDGTTELPSTLRDVLLGRIADLGEGSQEFLRVASAAGQRVDPELLAEAAGLEASAVYEALRECVARQVLVPDPTAGVERYVFRHALLQEAVYDELLPGERTRLHAAFARTLEARAGDDASGAAELAYHWYAAHDLPRALESAVVAGQWAEAGYAFPEALHQFERAIGLWDQVSDAEARAGRDLVDLLAAAASVARFHEPGRAVQQLRTAIGLVDVTVDPVRAGLLNERLGRCAWIAGQGGLANEAYRRAMDLIPTEPPSEARARVMAGLAQILMLGGHFAESLSVAQDALGLARAVGARDTEGHALNTVGVNRGVLGDMDAALADLDVALAIAEAAGNVDDIGRAYANRAWLLDSAGRLEEAIVVCATGIATSQRLMLMRFFGTHLLCNLADETFRLGRWDETEQALQRAEAVGPLGISEILVAEMQARLALSRGRFDEAAERLRPLARLAERATDIQFVVPVQASLVELALWQRRPKDAAVQVEAAIRLIDFTPEVRIAEVYALGVRAHADVAEVARARRSPAAADEAVVAGRSLVEAMRRRHAEVVATRPAYEELSGAWLLLCEAEATRLDRRPDPDAWIRSTEAWTRLGRQYVAAYGRWREAEARLAVRGDRELAAAALRAALAVVERLGAEPLRAEVLALAGRARLDLEAAEPKPAAEEKAAEPDDVLRLGLTPREREVLALVALGRTNRQIADELFISENTAGVHVSNILGKLGVAGRGEAAAVAYRLGLVEPAREAR
jgi:ATP/maltotriose-dependent transcriptional regulator MalT